MRLERTASGATVTGANYPARDYPDSEITEKIIACAITVHRALGPGFLEMIYERAMAHEVISTLKAFGARVGLLINFNEAKVTDGVRRVVLTNS